MPGISGLILNGGKARRMGGRDKAWLEVDGEPIIVRQLRLLEPLCDEVAVVVGQSGEARDIDTPILSDRVGGLGPLDGIAAGLAWASSEWLLVLACDMPAVNPALLELLIAGCKPGLSAVAPFVDGRVQPLIACYHRRLLPAMDERLEQGNLSAQRLFLSPPDGVEVLLIDEASVRSVDPELCSFANLNSPKEVLRSGGRIE